MNGPEVELRLAPGVRVGAKDNPVVYVPERGSFHIDPRTRDFLASLQHPSAATQLDAECTQTVRSVATLVECGILLAPETNMPEHGIRPVVYSPELADLVLKREGKLAGRLVRGASRLVPKLVTAPGIVCGLALGLIGAATIVTRHDFPAGVRSWVNNPILTLITFAVLALTRLVLHEAGHYAVTTNETTGPPEVGWGVYLTGPVLYVDMSGLDTSARSTRLRGDLAGLAVDGYVLAVWALASLLWSSPPAVFEAVSLSMVALVAGSLNPIVKSDINWALRDYFGARCVTAAWGRPRMFVSIARAAEGGVARYTRWTLLAYVGFIVVGLTVAGKWLHDIAVQGIPSITLAGVLPLLLTAAFVIASLAALKLRRKELRR